MRLSAIIPARNEEALLEGTLRAAVRAVEHLSNGRPGRDVAGVLVVDNRSTDRTAEVARGFARSAAVRVLECDALGAARARNHGARNARGDVLVFIDADTQVPPEAFSRVLHHANGGGYEAGIARLAPLDGGVRARIWWTFWNHVRLLPLPRAKAMPAFMFCTRDVFDEFGPFDERVAIAEEWPILAGLYRARRRRLVYDRSMTARSSSRRMELQPFGYVRNFAKYVWAILHFRGRVHYTDRIRAPLRPDGRPALGFRVRSWLGDAIARVEVHRVEPVDVDGERFYAKRRRWHAALAIAGGNAYLASRRAGVRFLQRRAWVDREDRVHRALYGSGVGANGRGPVLVPARPGIAVSEWLRSGFVGRDTKLEVLRAAVVALRALHETEIEFADGGVRTLSHGDATTRNVLYDARTGRANWFDFETAHADDLPAAVRRADDLRALTGSAASYVAPDLVEWVAEVVVGTYGDGDALDELRARLDVWRRRPEPFHLAQTRLDHRRRERLFAALGRR